MTECTTPQTSGNELVPSGSPPALTPIPSPEGRGEIVAPAEAARAEIVFPETVLAELADDPRVVLDEAKKRAALFYISLGASRRMAARQVGCCHRTIARAAARDAAFAAELARAESLADAKCLQIIGRATDQEQYWRAAAWVLERRNPEEFGQRKPHTFSADRVMEMFTRFLHAVLPKLPAVCRDTLLDAYDDIVGELAKDPNALPDRAKLAVKDVPAAPVKDVPAAPVTAPPPPPPPELQCPRDEAAARAWIKGLTWAQSEAIWDRARNMPDTPDWNYWRTLLREESDKKYRQELRERKERKERRALEQSAGAFKKTAGKFGDAPHTPLR